MTEWQPIATAPKDEWIDLWVIDSVSGLEVRYTDCIFLDGKWIQPLADENRDVEPYDFIKATHWMPNPQPPQS